VNEKSSNVKAEICGDEFVFSGKVFVLLYGGREVCMRRQGLM